MRYCCWTTSVHCRCEARKTVGSLVGEVATWGGTSRWVGNNHITIQVYIEVSIVMGVPQNGWFVVEILLKLMIWGYPYFRKPPYVVYQNPKPLANWDEVEDTTANRADGDAVYFVATWICPWCKPLINGDSSVIDDILYIGLYIYI